MKMPGLPEKITQEILKQGRLYQVGGAVRDFLLTGKETAEKDYLVTGISLERLTEVLKESGKVDLVGKSFGVIKFTPFSEEERRTFDIALPRREHSIGPGHRDFEVQFDHTLKVEDDLGRRDFTVNALAKNLGTGELIDPFNGQKDIQRRIIRQVFPEAFSEDPLRMLRAAQFAARFGFEIETDTFQSLKKNAYLISSVSPERIQDELNKLLLKADRPSLGFHLIQKSGLLRHILPELEACAGIDQPGGWHRFDVFEHTLLTIDNCSQNLVIRLAALFHDINKPQTRVLVAEGATFYGHEIIGARTAEKVMSRLRYSNETINVVRLLVDKHMFTTNITDKGLRRLIKKTEGRIFELLELRKADILAQGRGAEGVKEIEEFEKLVREEIARKPPFGLKDLKIDGHVIMEKFGLSPGPAVGKVLNHLLEKVLDDPQFNQEGLLLKEAEGFLQGQNLMPS
jgi:poly(A) polymerase/tRNA nucleotidyltransferase (CCA-adding enzyme)